MNRRALFSFFAALPLLPFAGAAKVRPPVLENSWLDSFVPVGNINMRRHSYKTLYVSDAIEVPIEEFWGAARIKNNIGVPWVWFWSPSRRCWCKAYNPNYQQKADQPLPTWREQIKFEAVPLSTNSNK